MIAISRTKKSVIFDVTAIVKSASISSECSVYISVNWLCHKQAREREMGVRRKRADRAHSPMING